LKKQKEDHGEELHKVANSSTSYKRFCLIPLELYSEAGNKFPVTQSVSINLTSKRPEVANGEDGFQI